MVARELAAEALTEVGCAYDVGRLAGFVRSAERIAIHAGRLRPEELDECRRDGAWAAETGVRLSELVDVYLSATRLLWVHLATQHGDRRDQSDLAAVGACLFQAVDDALAQVAAAYADAHRAILRDDETTRRDLVEALLLGSGQTSSLLTRAEQYGLAPSGWHCVIVLGGEEPTEDAQISVSDLEAAIRQRLPGHGALVTPRQGRLVAVLQLGPSADRSHPRGIESIRTALLAAAGRIAGEQEAPIVSVSRPRHGLSGISASFREADDGFTLSLALGWRDRLVHADELAVYRVLLRDHDSIVELVESVLGPLREARGGAQPLLETLYAFLSTGAVATETGRRLHLSVRAITYRLDRIRRLTGYDPADVDHRLTLHVAVAGAHLLGWGASGAEPPGAR